MKSNKSNTITRYLLEEIPNARRNGFWQACREKYFDGDKFFEDGDDEACSYKEALEEFMSVKPNLVPDIWYWEEEKKNFVWIEIDDCHPTSESKILSIGLFVDYLLDKHIGINVLVYRLDPITTEYFIRYDRLFFGYRFATVRKSKKLIKILNEPLPYIYQTCI